MIAGAAADRRRLRQPVPGARPGRTATEPDAGQRGGRRRAGRAGRPDTVFGVVGSGNFHVTNALVARGARFVAARHEGGAASMADGWARMTGRPGIVTVHQGPGLTNALTGITEAAKSRTPLLVLAADVAAARCGPTSGSTWPRWPPRSARCTTGCTPPASPSTTRSRAYRTARRRAAHGGARDAAGHPGGAVRPRRQSGRCRALHRPGARPRRRSAAPRRRRSPAPGGRCSSRAGEHGRPGARDAPGDAGGRLRGTAGHLGGGQGPVPRQPVGPGRERRLRLAAGGRADQPAPTWSSAGAPRSTCGRCATARLIGPGASVAQMDDDGAAIGAHRPVDIGCGATWR